MPGGYQRASVTAVRCSACATYRQSRPNAEAMRLCSIPRMSYRHCSKFFFQIQTQTRSTGRDKERGTSYRSGIYIRRPSKKQGCEDTIADVEASKRMARKGRTEVAPAGPFWSGAGNIRIIWKNIRTATSCHFVRPTGKLPRRAEAAKASELHSIRTREP